MATACDQLPEHLRRVTTSANEVIARGGTVYFKWTCGFCCSRQTFPDANKLYISGRCEECGTITSLLDPAADANFMAVFGFPPDLVERMKGSVH